jgi:hypothetical protein
MRHTVAGVADPGLSAFLSAVLSAVALAKADAGLSEASYKLKIDKHR